MQVIPLAMVTNSVVCWLILINATWIDQRHRQNWMCKNKPKVQISHDLVWSKTKHSLSHAKEAEQIPSASLLQFVHTWLKDLTVTVERGEIHKTC